MKRVREGRRPLVAIGSAALCAALVAGCGGNGNGNGGGSEGDGGGSAAGGTFTWWDPYPQHEDGSDWDARVQDCGAEAGVDIDRTTFDTSALTNQALLAGQEGNAPDVILLDNPAVSTLAEAGMLETMGEFGLDTSQIDPNLIAAGELEGEQYGIPIGANTLALFYNEDVLGEAGVDPASITDWASLTTALEAVNGAGFTGITFAGIGTEEGSFQFLPWFWGSGAELRELDSPQAVSSLELWVSWLDAGLAPQSVIDNSQNTTWEEFLTGEFGFVENGTWQINSATEADFPVGVIQIPGETGDVAPTPTGGEFITVPVQGDTERYTTTQQIVECMTTTDGLVETGQTFAYYIPPTTEGQESILTADDADLEPWVEAVRSARGRTADDLGTQYPVISEQLWTAVQRALSGDATAQEALTDAQAQSGS